MRLRRLGWAGVELEHSGQTLVIDLLGDASPLFSDEKFPPASRPGETAAALVTHLHSDHADPVAIRKALADGAPVYRPEPVTGEGDDLEWTCEAEAAFREHGIAAEAPAVGGARRRPVPYRRGALRRRAGRSAALLGRRM